MTRWLGLVAPPAPLAQAASATPLPPVGPQPDGLRESFYQVVLIGARRSANNGLTVASPSFLRSTFGLPREDLNDTCRSMTNPRLRDLLRTDDVGPFRVTMLAPTVSSLRKVFAEVQSFEPELYDLLASSGRALRAPDPRVRGGSLGQLVFCLKRVDLLYHFMQFFAAFRPRNCAARSAA